MGILPGIILYLSGWYRRMELQTRIGFFWAAASLAGAFGGLLAAAIATLQGRAGLNGWSWIFIIEGIVTVLVGLSGFFLIARSPYHTRFLTSEQREYEVARLEYDAAHASGIIVDGKVSYVAIDDSFTWRMVLSVYADPQIYGLAVIAFMSGTSVYSVAYFLPTIVAGLTFIATTVAITQLLTVP